MAIVIAGFCPSAGADELSLPLNGYFHPGRAMPVRWNFSSPPASEATIDLSVTGAVRTRVELSGAQYGVFPWLVIGRAASSSQIATPLHALQTSDCLVATELSDDSLQRDLFPGRSVVTIHLDPDESIQGPPMAWETLDALVLTEPSYSRLSSSFRMGLYLSGVALAVAGAQTQSPDGDFPWKRVGSLWVASTGLGVPTIVSADAFAPTWGWTAGRSGEFRARIFLLGAIFCLAVGGAALWRARWMPVGVAVLCAGFAVAFIWDDHRQSPIAKACGTVLLISDQSKLTDRWFYVLSHREANFSFPISGGIHPIFADSSQPEQTNLTLICDRSGYPTGITGRLIADSPLAFLSRSIVGSPQGAPEANVESPMRTLAVPSIYPGYSVLGQSSAKIRGSEGAQTVWPMVILQRNLPSN